MDSGRHYERLIERARGRALDGYRERHHVVPRCVGGGDEDDNIVELTPEEHFVAHQLLVRIYPGHKGLIWALLQMTGGNRRQPRRNKAYGWMRRMFASMISESSRGRRASPEARERMRLAKLGKKRGKYRSSPSRNAGVPKSEEHRLRLRLAKLGKKRGKYNLKDREAKNAAISAGRLKTDNTVYTTPEYRASQAERSCQSWAKRKQLTIE